MLAVICTVFLAVVAPGNLQDSIGCILPNSAFSQQEVGVVPMPLGILFKRPRSQELIDVH